MTIISDEKEAQMMSLLLVSSEANLPGGCDFSWEYPNLKVFENHVKFD